MELFFCQSPIAQEESRDLPRRGCLFSLNTFPYNSASFLKEESSFVSSSLLSTCWEGAGKICFLVVVRALVFPMYFTPGCAGGKRVELTLHTSFPRPAPAFPRCSREGGSMALSAWLNSLAFLAETFHICISGKQQLPLSPWSPLTANSSWFSPLTNVMNRTQVHKDKNSLSYACFTQFSALLLPLYLSEWGKEEGNMRPGL